MCSHTVHILLTYSPYTHAWNGVHTYMYVAHQMTHIQSYTHAWCVYVAHQMIWNSPKASAGANVLAGYVYIHMCTYMYMYVHVCM